MPSAEQARWVFDTVQDKTDPPVRSQMHVQATTLDEAVAAAKRMLPEGWRFSRDAEGNPKYRMLGLA